MILFTITAFLSLFAVANPLGTVPVLIAITQESGGNIRWIAARAALTAMIALVLFSLLGQYILDFFHLSIAAIRVAGGFVLLQISLEMIQAKQPLAKSRREEQDAAKISDDVSIVPVGIPMLCGPGSITTALVLGGQAKNFGENLLILVAIVFTMAAAYLVLSRANLLLRLLRQTGINILTRLMGLLLTALAIQYIIVGIGDSFPILKR